MAVVPFIIIWEIDVSILGMKRTINNPYKTPPTKRSAVDTGGYSPFSPILPPAIDTDEDIELFEQAAEKNHSMGIYMLGYCYRNGYGVAIDAVKAKTYYTKAAALGLERAKLELAQPQAENANPTQIQTLSTNIEEEVENAPIEAPKKIKKVKQITR